MDLKEHNIIQLLQPFQKAEIHSLKKFIASPYFNTNVNISKIFDELIKFHPNFESKNFSKLFIFKKVFKDKIYNDSNMRWMLSEIHHLIEKYFAQKHFDKDVLVKDYFLSREYFAGMKKEFVLKSLVNAKKNLSTIEDKDYIFHFYKYIHLTNEMNYIMLFKRDKKLKDLEFCYNNFLQAMISYINHFIIGITYDYLNAEILVSKYLKNGVSKKINDLVKLLNLQRIAEFIDNDNEHAEGLRGLIKVLNMFLYPEDDLYYKELRNYILTNEKQLSKDCCASYYSKIIAYCRLKISNSVKQDYYRTELFEITKLFFEKKYFKLERFGYLSPTLYRLTLLNCVELGELDFAEQLMKKHSQEMAESHRKHAVNYGTALINFYKKDFDKALLYSSKIGGDFFLTDQKVLRIMLFIEKGFFEECNVEVKAFKKFLQTNKFLSPDTKQSLEEFLEFIPYLINSPQKRKFIPNKQLRNMIEDSGIVLFKDWVTEKINGL